jgi:hypothetical protein
MSLNTLDAYGEIVRILHLTHGEKAFSRSELMNLYLQELNVFREDTQVAHLKTMAGMEYILLVSPGSAYKQATYKLGPKGLEMAKRLIREKID